MVTSIASVIPVLAAVGVIFALGVVTDEPGAQHIKVAGVVAAPSDVVVEAVLAHPPQHEYLVLHYAADVHY